MKISKSNMSKTPLSILESMTASQSQVIKQTAILNVDSNIPDTQLMRRALERTGFEGGFLTAPTADSAYRLIAERLDKNLSLPNLILLEQDLHGESGLEMLEKLKSEPALSKIKVVLLSTSQSTKDMARARELGAEWYFVKPSNPRDLVFIAQELLAIAVR